MSKPRLGRAERLLKRQVFEGARKAQLIDQQLRLASDHEPTTSRGYHGTMFGSPKSFKSKMTHGLYRGLYDPLYSTVKDTGRGLKP